ncbi:family 1 glycosylhydrolase [Nodosilinea sp. P-1105]|uniref:family 1 glycosylhydrolase n=1 Tax=Nodosilinea sp. P-1105 TaxID=2546229 RepID=UPI00146ACCFC|nr:glycosyl hydrolase family protein [Nodosilinea sp. P-1105]
MAVSVIETPEHIKAAELATHELNASFLTVMLEGRYTDAHLVAEGENAAKFTEEDLRIIASPLDFVGINVYLAAAYAKAIDTAPGYEFVPINDSHPRTASPWHRVTPEAIYWAPRFVQSLWNVQAIYITESRCSASDSPDDQGHVYDTDRITYLRSYLTQLQRATADGVSVRGYFHWSTLFEENTPRAPIDVPILIAHGTADPLIPIELSEAEAARRCEASEDVQFARYPGSSHDARDDTAVYILGWVVDRFAGRPSASNCEGDSISRY